MKTRVSALWTKIHAWIWRIHVSLRAWMPAMLVLAWVQRIGRHNVPMYAAALAYYTLFSSIPLLVFLMTTGSYVLKVDDVEAIALEAFTAFLPDAASVIRVNLEGLLRYRGFLGAVSALGTLWSASGMFTALERAINAVWEQPIHRAYWVRRLLGMLALVALTAWVVIAGWVRSMWGVIQAALPALQEAARLSAPWRTQAWLWLSVTALMALVYRFFPARPVRWRTVIWVSMVTGLAWNLLRAAFSWALHIGLLRYPVFYGSLWLLLFPVLWAYWSYLLLLFGAEMVALVEEQPGSGVQRRYLHPR